MIPTAILLGLIGGAVPRYRWWAVPIAGVVWSIILETSGDPGMTFVEVWLGGFALAALNAAVGVAVTWALTGAISAIRSPKSGSTQS
jgi:hypothetical protein